MLRLRRQKEGRPWGGFHQEQLAYSPHDPQRPLALIRTAAIGKEAAKFCRAVHVINEYVARILVKRFGRRFSF
jgi:hypothetical protein